MLRRENVEVPGAAARELATFNDEHSRLPHPELTPQSLRRDYWPMSLEVPSRGIAESATIGGVSCRVVRTALPRGVYLHLHGGGFMLGSAARQDRQHEGIAHKLGVTVVSVDYRLAPEHPYPAGLDDAVAVAKALIHDPEFEGLPFLIGGESAGASLSVGTLLRLRDAGEPVDRFVGANLVYGCYSLAPLPSRDEWGDQFLVLSRRLLEYWHEEYAADPSDRIASPLHADVSGLPPALFTVGTEDPLRDDSELMAIHWSEAGNEATLMVWAGAPHAFDAFPLAVGGMVRRRLSDWMGSRL